MSEASSVLIGMMMAITADGDEQGAAKVGQVLVRLLEVHLAGVHVVTQKRANRKRSSSQPVLIPALMGLSKAVVDAYFRYPDNASRRVLREVAAEALRGGRRDSASELFATQLWLYRDHEDSSAILELVNVVGIRAIDDDASLALNAVQVILDRQMSRGLRGAIEAASYLCSVAVWRNYFKMKGLWLWFSQSEASADELRLEKAFGALRIGASGMLSGNLSMSVRAGVFLKSTTNVENLAELIQQRGQLEQFQSDQRGQYLGEDAEANLEKFRQLVVTLNVA